MDATEITFPAILVAKSTHKVPRILGEMWRNRILRSLAPMVLSPLIKLSCFNFMTSPRAILEKPTQELITMAISMLFTPCPRRPATAIISVRPGSPWKMLEIVVMTPSIQPPKYPAKSPRAKPSSMESTVAASARRMDCLPP